MAPKKLTKPERMILALAGEDMSHLYYCEEHGLFMNKTTNWCPFCKTGCPHYKGDAE